MSFLGQGNLSKVPLFSRDDRPATTQYCSGFPGFGCHLGVSRELGKFNGKTRRLGGEGCMQWHAGLLQGREV